MVGSRQNSTNSVHKTIGKPSQREAARHASTVHEKIMSCRFKEPPKKVPQLYEDANVPEFTDVVLQRVAESMSMVYRGGLLIDGHQYDIPDYATKLGLHLVLPTLPAFPSPNSRRLDNGDVPEESVQHLLVGCLILYDIYNPASHWGWTVIEGTTHLRFNVWLLWNQVIWDTNRSWNGIGWKISNDLRIATKIPLIHRDALLQCLEAALVMLCGNGSIDNLCCARLFVYLFVHHKCELNEEDWNSLDKKFFYTSDLREQVLLAKSFVEKFANDQSIDELSEEMEKLSA